MINHVQFPGLGLEMTINRVAFAIGNMPIYWYGICIALGVILAMAFAFYKAKSFGIDIDRMIDVIMLSTICAIVGGRAYYVLMAPFDYESFWDAINLRDGGMAIYGAVIAAFLSGWLFCKWRKVPVLPMFDVAAMGFLLGQGIGRWGNFFNQEAFGTNTTLPWGMYSESTQSYLTYMQQTLAGEGMAVNPALPVHPTFLYESLWCLLGFFLLWAYSRHRKFNGEIFLMYLAWYGFERFFVEQLRTDSLLTGGTSGLRVSVIVAGVSVVVAVIAWILLRIKYKGQYLYVNYQVFEKQADGPSALFVTWPASEKPPTDAQIREQVQIVRQEEEERAAQIHEEEQREQAAAQVKQMDEKQAVAQMQAQKQQEDAPVHENEEQPEEQTPLQDTKEQEKEAGNERTDH